MKVQKINTQLIKPHTQTPPHLKTYNLSFLDTCLSPMNLAVLLFYKSNPQPQTLQQSLSKILVDFYPLAGRYIKEQSIVDCNDAGAEFVSAEATGAEVNDLIGNSALERLNDLYPDQYSRCDEEASDPLLSIQATSFPCGGLVIAVSVSHRVFDIPSITTFISAWSAANNADKTVAITITPSFDIPALLPCRDRSFGVNLKKSSGEGPKIVPKRLLFDKEALTSLKSGIRPETISDSEIVSAFLAKALIRLDRAKQGEYRDFVVFQLINMREKTIQPVPKHSCANFSFTMLTAPAPATEETGVQEVADVIGEGVRSTVAELAGVVSPDVDGPAVIMNSLGSLMKAIQKQGNNFMVFSDCSEFGFYDADFGWGKPAWASITPQRLRSNAVVLMSSREGDGIEAWVHLFEEDMPSFDQDGEIKPFAF